MQSLCNRLLTIAVLSCLALLGVSGCAASPRAGDGILVAKLDASLGKEFASTDWSRPTGARTRQLPAQGDKKEYEYGWANGCVVVLSVEASTDRIVAWRFAENEAACRAIAGYTFGT